MSRYAAAAVRDDPLAAPAVTTTTETFAHLRSVWGGRRSTRAALFSITDTEGGMFVRPLRDRTNRMDDRSWPKALHLLGPRARAAMFGATLDGSTDLKRRTWEGVR